MQQHLDLLTCLPSTLSCIVLRDWLKLDSVMKVDSAYCCHTCRHDFLQLLQSEEYFIREQVNIYNDMEDGVRHFPECPYLFTRFGEKIRSIEMQCEEVTPEHRDWIIANCHNLTRVWVCGYDENSFTPDLWSLLENNPHIENLCLTVSDCNIRTRPFLRSMSKIVLPELNTLIVDLCKVEDTNILNVMKAPSIVDLQICCCELLPHVLVRIADLCPRLRSLNLSCTSPVTDEDLGKFAVACPHIVDLNICEVQEITDAGILRVVQNLKKLHALKISDVTQLTDSTLVHIYTHCASRLHTLLLDRGFRVGAPRFSSTALNVLLERCSQLHTLYFYAHCTTPLVFSPAAISNLKTLAFVCGVAIEQNLATITANGGSMQDLSISGEYTYTHDTLSNLIFGCPLLKELQIRVPKEPGTSIPEYLKAAYWSEIRPNLRFYV